MSSLAFTWRSRRCQSVAATLLPLLISCATPVASDAPAVSRVEVEPSATSITAGSTSALVARAFDEHGNVLNGQSIFWSTQNVSVATVTQDGVVTAIAPGTVQIAASVGGRSGVSAVTVIPHPVVSVRVTPPEATIAVGKTAPLVAQGLDAGGAVLAGRAVTWSTSAPAIATVSTGGVVTGVAPGTSSIHATIDGIQGTSVISVVPVAVAQVHVAPGTSTIVLGGFVQLSAATLDASGNSLTGRFITWGSSNQSVAVVSSSGRVQSVSPGTATISAMSEGIQGTASVTVTLAPVASVVIVPVNPSVVVGQTAALGVTLTDAGGNLLTGRVVTWVSKNTAVATVDASGTVTGVTAGAVMITATCEGISGSTTLSVSAIPVASVQVTPSAPSISVSQTAQLTATARDAQGNVLSGRVAVWTSNNAAVASVSAAGLVTGIGVGAATVTATIDGASGNSTVTVAAVPIASIGVTPFPAAVQERQTLQLTGIPTDAGGNVLAGRTLVWSSSNNAVAAVSQGGVVTGIAPGSVTIVASAPGAGAGGSTPSGSTSLTVTYAPVSTVQVIPVTTSVTVGGTVVFTANLLDAAGQPLSASGRSISWASLNVAKATVNPATGVATGVATGSAVIRASAASPGQALAVTADATLGVTSVPVASVTVSPNPATVHIGALYARAFTAVTRDAQGNLLTGHSLIWTSSNQNAATVDPSTGVVSGVATGSTMITATSDGVAGSSPVTIDLVSIVTVTVAPPTATVSVPGTQALSATFRDSAGNAVTGAALGGRAASWTSSNSAAASVSASGVVTAVAAGSATITGAIGSVGGTSAITVLGPVNSIVVAVSPDSVILPGTMPGTATVTDAAAHPLAGVTVSLTSSATAVATIAPSSATSDAAGKVAFTVTGVAAGSSTVTASNTGKSGTHVVRVLRPVSSVTIAPATLAVTVGGAKPATVTVRDAGNVALAGRVCAITSSDPSHVTVSPASATTNASGQIVLTVTGAGAGTATITATCETKSGSTVVTVS